MLPFRESEMKLDELAKQGMELRFVNKDLTMTPKEALGEYWDWIEKHALKQDKLTLGTLHDMVEVLKAEGELDADTQIGIIVRRNPRTRPNDLSILGLRGFMEEEYGNVMSVNSFDVANIFEGDYDADKMDYWFAHNKNFYDHISRTQKFHVQGIDVTRFIPKTTFNWEMSSDDIVEQKDQIAADLELYKSSIGRVQKIPRILS